MPSANRSTTTPGSGAGKESVGLMQLVGQCFSIGPLIDVALFLGIVASLAGAIGPLAVLLASIGMVAFSLVVAFYASSFLWRP